MGFDENMHRKYEFEERDELLDDNCTGMFTTDDFDQITTRIFSDDKPTNFSDFLYQSSENESEESGKTKRNRQSYSIVTFRENLAYYRGMDTARHTIQPSILRLNTGKNYAIILEADYIDKISLTPFMADCSTKPIELPLIARMQHYGFSSRLVDITSNPLIALYMACYTKFLTTGKIIEFSDPKYKNSSRSLSTKNHINYFTILGRTSTNVKNALDPINDIITSRKLNVASYRSSDPLAIINPTAYKRFNSTYDMRYNAQDGAFLLFLNEVDPITSIPDDSLDMKVTNKMAYKAISRKDKLCFLWKLAQVGITRATIYPDSEIALFINKYASIITTSPKFDFHRMMDEFREIRADIALLNTKDFIHLEQLITTNNASVSEIEFFLSDYISMLCERNMIKNHISYPATKLIWNEAVDRLSTLSAKFSFSYLKI